MKNHRPEMEHVDKMLREGYLSQPAASPGEDWYAAVMGSVRNEHESAESVMFPAMEALALRTGWVTAIAAAIIAITSVVTMPSRERLTWDMYKGGVVSEWFVRSGE